MLFVFYEFFGVHAEKQIDIYIVSVTFVCSVPLIGHFELPDVQSPLVNLNLREEVEDLLRDAIFHGITNVRLALFRLQDVSLLFGVHQVETL